MADSGCPRWVEGRGAAGAPGLRRALFLDRDGVVNVDDGYTHREQDFRFMPGIFELVRWAVDDGRAVVVVTNQAGIGRGYYDTAQFERLTRWMLAEFERQGAPLTRVYYCPHHAEAGVGAYRIDCPCRKPAPGMLLDAARQLALDLPGSLLVGDRESDARAGLAAGVGRVVLLGDAPAPGLAVERAADLPELLAGLARA